MLAVHFCFNITNIFDFNAIDRKIEMQVPFLLIHPTFGAVSKLWLGLASSLTHLIGDAGWSLSLRVEEVHQPGLQGGQLPVQLRADLDEQVVFSLKKTQHTVILGTFTLNKRLYGSATLMFTQKKLDYLPSSYTAKVEQGAE